MGFWGIAVVEADTDSTRTTSTPKIPSITANVVTFHVLETVEDQRRTTARWQWMRYKNDSGS